MIGRILPTGSPETCHPVTSTRTLDSFPVANVPLGDLLARRLERTGLEVKRETQTRALSLYLPADSWVSAGSLRRLWEAGRSSVLRDSRGDELAWVSESAEVPEAAAVVAADECSFRIRFPWDLLRVNEMAVEKSLDSGQLEQPPSDTRVEGRLSLGPGTRLLPGVYVAGDVIVGENCTIGPNCYIRGRTSIGAGCRIGQAVEIKNSIILSGSTIGHLSYCGDSIVCENVNFGAGTIAANFRHDGRNHRSMVQGTLVDTGRRKFGTIVGDGVHTGIHTSIYPGRKLWPRTTTLPGEIVRFDLCPHLRTNVPDPG